jgi:hypothetical protein
MRRKLPPFSAPQIIPRPRSLPLGNCPQPDPHGIHGDPWILNISKVFIFFGQNYDSSMTLFFIFLLKENKYFDVLLKKNKNNT